VQYLIDTDLVVDWLNGHEPTIRLIEPLVVNGIALSILTYAEVFEGIYGSRDPKADERAFHRLVRQTTILPISRRIARRAASLRRDLRLRRAPVAHRALDLFIAATALQYDLTLLTRNRRDYNDIPGLRLLP
jgi:tRNA(fMet)-specific endonuclease VapC